MSAVDSAQSGRTVAAFALAACVAILIAKAALIARININWDEFLYLTHVHELLRGELAYPYQTQYTWLFAWLPLTGANEVSQIASARVVMLALLIATSGLIWKLASRWTMPGMALIAPLCYLATYPVLTHGTSFRADSMLAPLTVGVLVLLTARPVRFAHYGMAGACLGVALAITVKAVLLAPVVLAIACLDRSGRDGVTSVTWKEIAQRLFKFGLWAGIIAMLLLLAHRIALPPAASRTVTDFASHVAGRTLLNAPFLPQQASLYATLSTDWAIWLLLGAGLLAALARKNFMSGACALSLLPILFYRNSFPYYYVVMLAPACVLGAIAADAAKRGLQRHASPAFISLALFGLVGALSAIAALKLRYLSEDMQTDQRTVIAAVHAVFPEPVPYIDHSGMIASFPKVNFFMSSWGMENYRSRQRGFVAKALREHRPPMLLANRPVLDANAGMFQWLLPQDQELIKRFYLPYWGPISVAGASFTLSSVDAMQVRLPFSGSFRLEAMHPLLVDGILRNPGDIVTTDAATVNIQLVAPPVDAVEGRLIVSAARPPPPGTFPVLDLYTGL